MRKWGDVYIDASEIVDFVDFNKAINHLKSGFNGNINREVHPTGVWTSVSDNAIHKCVAITRPNLNILTDNTTGGHPGDLRGMSFTTYSGSWITIDEFQEYDFKAGLVHWEYSFHYIIDQYFSRYGDQRLQLELFCNGLSVCSVTPIGRQINSFRVFCDFFSQGGTLNFKVRGRTNTPGSKTRDTTQLHIFGQQHLIRGVWR